MKATDPAVNGIVRARRCFYAVLALSFVVKIWLAASFPMTGDEAFFYQWGRFPAWGYSDHPAMVGWMLYVLNSVSDHPLALRSVTVLLWMVIAWGLVDLMRRLSLGSQERAWWLGCLFLALPFTWALNLVTTDTPLIFFIFASAYCFVRGNLSDKLGWSAACGVFLGLALLSKYFAGLLAIAYFGYLIHSRRGWLNLAIIALCALPFFAINITYNATHCWSNVMFNFINRNEGAHWSFRTVAVYVAMMLYVVTPWVFYKVVRARELMGKQLAVAILFLIPFALFLLLSVMKTIGLHWVLGFMPFVFLFLALATDAAELRHYFRWTAWFALPHFLVLAAIIVLPLSVWEGTRLHDDIVFHKESKTIVASLRNGLPAGGKIMARAYTPASLLSYHADEYWPVFGAGSHHARQDDIIVDFRQYSGLPVRIFDRKPMNQAEFAPYFASVKSGSFQVVGVTFWYVDGQKFNYQTYREGVLKNIAKRFYNIPSFLPMYGCSFLERYDFER